MLPVGFLALAVADLCPENCRIFRLSGIFFDCHQTTRAITQENEDDFWIDQEDRLAEADLPSKCVDFYPQSSRDKKKCPENCLLWRDNCDEYICEKGQPKVRSLQAGRLPSCEEVPKFLCIISKQQDWR